MNKIKILYIVSTLRKSGPTNQLFNLVKNIDKEVYEVKILTLSPDPENNQRADFNNLSVELDSLNLSRFTFQLKGSKLLNDYVHKYSPDIIHTTGVRADTVVSKLSTQAHHFMTIRNFVYEDYIAKFGNFIGTYAAKSSIKAMEKCKNVVFCSYSLEKMYNGLLPKTSSVVQNGVNISKFRTPATFEDKKQLRMKLNLPIENKIFVVVGSLISRKDPLTIVKAFNEQTPLKDATLLFLGDGDLVEECKKEADENVIFMGEVNNISEYLTACDVFVSSSKSEGLPNSVLEAGISGLSLIISDIPQHREIFNSNMQLASFFPVGDVIQLRKLMNNEMMKDYDYIDFELSAYVENTFSDSSMAKQYEELYKKSIELNGVKG